MGGATSVMPVTRDALSQQAANTTQWADTMDWTVRCERLYVASFHCTRTTQCILMRAAKLVEVLQVFLQVLVVIASSCNL